MMSMLKKVQSLKSNVQCPMSNVEVERAVYVEAASNACTPKAFANFSPGLRLGNLGLKQLISKDNPERVALAGRSSEAIATLSELQRNYCGILTQGCQGATLG